MNQLLARLLRGTDGGARRFWFAVVLAALASGASVALMGVSAWLISRAAEMPPVLYLQVAAVGVRAFGISRGVFRYLERLVGHDVALRMQSALRLEVFTKLSATTLIGRRRGDLLTRVVADVKAIQDLVVRVAIPVLSASLVIVGTTLMLGRFSPLAAGVLLITSIVAGGVVPVLAQRATLAADLAAAPTRGHLADGVREIARTASDLVAYDAAGPAVERMLRADAELRRQEARGAWVRGLATSVQILAAGLAVVAALWIGAPQVISGDLEPRLLAVLVLTPLALHEVLTTFAQAAQSFTRSRAALERVQEILDADPIGAGDATDHVDEQPGLRVQQLAAGWPGAAPVVTGVDIEVLPGQRVALVGPSGSGKTTVAATIMGQIPPLAGSITRGGRVGYLSQDAHIFTTTVAENVRIGNREATDEQVRDALNRARLDLDADLEIGESGMTLSGGQRRRLALARILVGTRDVIVLDEPTEHLDQPTAAALMADVWQATRGDAVLVATHDPEVTLACDRVVRLTGAGH
ncbi:MAG: thiol reductant ABC exporter subunit CydC [Arachnia sp.]